MIYHVAPAGPDMLTAPGPDRESGTGADAVTNLQWMNGNETGHELRPRYLWDGIGSPGTGSTSVTTDFGPAYQPQIQGRLGSKRVGMSCCGSGRRAGLHPPAAMPDGYSAG